MKIEAIHKFQDDNYSREWSERFEPTTEKLALFDLISSEISKNGSPNLILELGIGPGYLADYILKRHKDCSYTGIDFSRAMLEISASRLNDHKNRINLLQLDLLSKWSSMVKMADVIVSTWALHDLMSGTNILHVYQQSNLVLSPSGILLNGDFVKPSGISVEFEAGRLEHHEHISLLTIAGFVDPQVLCRCEVDLDHPTTSNNYSCFKATKR